MAKKTPVSTQPELVVCDLEFSRMQRELQSLDSNQLEMIERALGKIHQMTWDQVYKTSSKTQKRGINWEPISGQRTATGKAIASIRISDKFRARVCRDGKFMRFVSLHPDHDGAYTESGGEIL